MVVVGEIPFFPVRATLPPWAFYAVLIATSVTAVYAYINFKIARKWQSQWFQKNPSDRPNPAREPMENEIYFYFYYSPAKLSQHSPLTPVELFLGGGVAQDRVSKIRDRMKGQDTLRITKTMEPFPFFRRRAVFVSAFIVIFSGLDFNGCHKTLKIVTWIYHYS